MHSMKSSDIFMDLASLGPVSHGSEDKVYGERLSSLGFLRTTGAWVLRPEARIILAAHLDTVQYTSPIQVIEENGWAKGVGGGLGADDKAGVALVISLSQKLDREDVGFALFLGEEVGCVGASEAKESGVFSKAQAVISLDRKGEKEVIYQQSGYPTASLKAASWLGEKLGLVPSDKGVWTDSACLAPVVPEAMNVAVGYVDAHSNHDRQNLVFLDRLEEGLLQVPWEEMPIEREPKEDFFWGRGSRSWGSWDWGYYDYDYGYYNTRSLYGNDYTFGRSRRSRKGKSLEKRVSSTADVVRLMKLAGWDPWLVLELLLEDNPVAKADLLDMLREDLGEDWF